MATSSASPSSPAMAAVLALLLLLSPWAAPAADALCDAGDKQILLDLKQSLGNPPALVTWQSNSTDCCGTWPSMECNDDGRVNLVYIQSVNNVPGVISPSIGGLTYLEQFKIRRYSNLTGPIPDTIGKLEYLSVLQLERTQLNGFIPASIGQLKNLAFLSVSQNRLSGPIPASLGNLYNVRELYLDSNQLTGGVPASLSNLDPERVNISRNKLSGDVSALISGWTSAVTVDISGNAFRFKLSGVKFPPVLEIFLMKGNAVYGTIPGSADGMKGLQQFDVSNNKLCGTIPQGGVVNKFPASSFEGNDCLCGKPLLPCWLHNCKALCLFSATSASSSSSSLPSSDPVQVSR